MSTIPVVTQRRRTVIGTNGDVQFEVTSTITDRGDLPFVSLFVLRITDPADAKDDVLARVASPLDIRRVTPASAVYVRVVETDLIRIGPDPFARIANVDDLTEMPRDRTTAVRTGQTLYLSPVFTALYDGITTAQAAYQAILQRLSDLVTAWRTYYGDFETRPTSAYDLPVFGAGVEAQRTAAYVVARDARVAAEAARDAAQTAKDRCEQDCTADKAIYDFLVADVAFLVRAKDLVTAMATSTARDFVLQQGAYTSNADSYNAMLSQKRTALDTYGAKVAECAARCSALGEALLAARSEVDAAREAERAALAGVYAVCPTFDPTSV